MTIFTTRSNVLATAAFGAAMITGAAPVAADGYNGNYHNNNNGQLTVYFTRHAEKQTKTLTGGGDTALYSSSMVEPNQNGTAADFEFTRNAGSTTSKGEKLEEVCGVKKCAEELSGEGKLRAMLLADWFVRRGVIDELDAVYATHKLRTQQTVTPTATVAGLLVTQLDPNFTELNPESTSPSECSTLQAIEAARAAGMDTILIAGHSGTLYDIMGTGVSGTGVEGGCMINDYEESIGLGLNTGNTVDGTGDPDRFPKSTKAGKEGKVANFGDIWKVVINHNGDTRFGYRTNLQPQRLSTFDIAR